MNTREQVKNLILKQPTDRMGFTDRLWPETIAKWREQGYLKKKNEITGEMEDVSFDDWFDCDMAEEFGGVILKPLPDYLEVIEENENWNITKNGFGAVFKLYKNQTGVREHIAFEMDSMDVWQEKYKPHLLDLNMARMNPAGTSSFLARANANDKYSVFGHVFIWECLREALGDIQMFMSLIEDPEWILDFNRTYTDFFKAHYGYLFEHCGCPDCFWIYEDLAYNKGPFCSPGIIREFFVPFYKEITDFLRSYNIAPVLHSCGNIETVLPLIVESGFVGLNPMEVKAGCDVVKFAEKYGDKLTFIGGFDVRILSDGDKDTIKKEVLRICDGMRRTQAGYFFGSDHSIPPSVDYESYQYALDVFKDNCMY